MGKFTEYKLPLKSLPLGTHTFEYHIGKQFFTNMENNDVRSADLHVTLNVDHRGDYYNLSFLFVGTVTVACDRCLDDLEIPIDTTFDITVKYGDDYNDDSDDYLQIPESDQYLNVAYMMHDTIALAIPIKHVHPLGKCNRAMSSLLKKHRAGGSIDPDEAELENELIDEIDNIDATPTDSRWDKLKDFNPEG